MDDTADTLRRLNQKVVGYLAEIQSDSFQERFGSPDRVQIRILIECEYAVSSAAQGLVNVLSKKAAEVGVELQLVDSAA